MANRTRVCWSNIIKRCTMPNRNDWRYYGGRGITVCDRWRVFENFLADMGEQPEGKWLDRIDNARGYEPGNCRWITPSESALNRRLRADNDANCAKMRAARAAKRAAVVK